jgi:hypothetical protein
LLACLLACFSVAAIAQVRPVYELPDKDEVQRSTEAVFERVRQMDIKIEKDANGRVTRVISEGVVTDVMYDATGKIDGYSSDGRITKIRTTTDANRNPVMRFFDGAGTELQPVDLKANGFLPSIINSMSTSSLFPATDMIDIKEFARLERQRSLERSASLLANKPSQKPLAKFIGDGDVPRFTPQQCQLKCDLERELGYNQCDRDSGDGLFWCAVGTAALLESAAGAAIFAGACTAANRRDLSTCRDNIAKRHYNCSLVCN